MGYTVLETTHWAHGDLDQGSSFSNRISTRRKYLARVALCTVFVLGLQIVLATTDDASRLSAPASPRNDILEDSGPMSGFRQFLGGVENGFNAMSHMLLGDKSLSSMTGQKRTEPETGVSFPLKYTMQGKQGSELDLIGVGVRAKWGIKVYAAALYADSRRAKSVLSNYNGIDAASLADDPGFTEAVKHGDFDKAMVMQMTRRIPQPMLMKAIGTSINPRLKPSEKKILPTFDRIVDSALNEIGVINRDTQIRMEVSRKNSLCVSVNKVPPRSLRNKPLCDAIVDMYVGADPVSPAAKKDICAGFSRLLAPSSRPSLNLKVPGMFSRKPETLETIPMGKSKATTTGTTASEQRSPPAAAPMGRPALHVWEREYER